MNLRVDLQVDGMGVRGHDMLINEPWQVVRRRGFALAQVHNKNVSCQYTELPANESEVGKRMRTEFFGVFTPDPAVVFIPAETYNELG